MAQEHGTTASKAAQGDLAAAMAGLDDLVRRLQSVHASLQAAISKPSTALFGLVSADMDAATTTLAGVANGLSALRTLRAELAALDTQADPKRARAIGKDIDAQVWKVQQSVRLTLDAIQRADRNLAADGEWLADAALEADKFLYTKAPEMLGALTVTLTKSKQAGALVESAASVVQRGVAGISAKIVGVSAADVDAVIGSMEKTEIDAVVKLLVALFAPHVADTANLSHVLTTLGLNVSKEVFNAARAAREKKLEGEALERALMAAAVKGYASTLSGMIKKLPILEDSEISKKIFDAFAKCAVAAVMADIKQTDVPDAVKDAAWDATKDMAIELGREHVTEAIAEREGDRVREGSDSLEGAKAIKRAEQTEWLRKVLGIDLNAKQPQPAMH